MNIDVVNSANLLAPFIGFRQTIARKEYIKLSSDLIADPTQSQQFVNAVSEYFLRVEAINNSLEFVEGYDIDLYSNAVDYEVEEFVKINSNGRDYIYVSKQANGPGTSIENPVDNPDFWESYLSYRLRQYRESAAREVIQSALADQIIQSFSSEAKKTSVIYSETTTAIDTQTKGRFVGVEIRPQSYRINRLLIIEKVFLHITGTTDDIELHLFHSSKNQAIQTFTISGVDNNGKWYDLDDGSGNPVVIDLYDESFNQGGIFHLGLFEGELAAGQGYKHYENIWPIRSLNETDAFTFQSVEIKSDNLNNTDRPNYGQYFDLIDKNDELPMNLRFEDRQSFYPIIEDNIHLFIKPYQYKLASMILQDMMVSDRISEISDNAQAKIDEILYGSPDNPRNKGILAKYDSYYKKLINDLNKLIDYEFGMFQGNI